MDFMRRTSRVTPKIASLQEIYPHDLQFYRIPPSGRITLDEFHQLSMERMKVLRIIESVHIQSDITPDQRLPIIISQLRNDKTLYHYVKLLKTTGSDVPNEAQLIARQRDHTSHFILHLAHCLTDDLKRWLIAREVELFKLRYRNLSSEAIQQFLKINDLNYVPISQNDKDDIKQYLCQSTWGHSEANVDVTNFYKVSFDEVGDLVKSRKVYVKSGFAYIPEKELVTIFVTIFRIQLAQALACTRRGIPMLHTDERIRSFMKNFHNCYMGDDYLDNNGPNIPIENLDALSKTSYPLCMRVMHETLRSKHHLKHVGRQQYGLFLKGIGVLLEDALRFWQEEFCKVMEPDKFEKTYAYNIRHNFGKAGKRTNYTPYSCIKIITSNVGPDQIHGCPFKELDALSLKKKMLSYGLTETVVQDVAHYAQKKHYQIACTRYFEAVHKCPSLNTVMHPNTYFKESQKLLNGGNPAPAKSMDIEYKFIIIFFSLAAHGI
ncbi:DNA primase large subunit isoform X2 [Athalia rosae]|uniref:DNA primase large subunit isoform X2 n=1 Tax=Athalia rosae TaxID=37344 RepID=UPI0020337004|nr:DNA primase large subunit isoform X2 [Athalia rosae]